MIVDELDAEWIIRLEMDYREIYDYLYDDGEVGVLNLWHQASIQKDAETRRKVLGILLNHYQVMEIILRTRAILKSYEDTSWAM